MKKKVLVIGALPPPTGGMQTVMEQMCSLKIEGIEIIPFNVAKNKIIKSNIIINTINFIYRCVKLFLVLLFKNPDIVHIHVASDIDVIQKNVFHKICKIMGKKTILHMHGADFDTWYQKLNSKKKLSVKKFLNSCDYLIVLSESWKIFYEKITDVQVIIINNAIEDINFNEYKRIYPKEEFIVLFLSIICKRKGAYDLLKAISIIKDSKIKFVFVGPYEDEKFFFNEVDRLNIRNKCEFIGEVIGKERFKYFASADVFVLPSYAEGLPVAILEAMSFGLPIISTTVGAIPEVIKKENGMLIKPGNVKKLAITLSQIYNRKNQSSMKKINKQLINSKYILKIFMKNITTAYNNVLKK